MEEFCAQQEAERLRVQVADLQVALRQSEQARIVAEERAAQVSQAQRAAAPAARELTSLQSIFKHALEENRGLLTQLQAARARITQLEAGSASTAGAYRAEAQQANQSYPEPPPVVHLQASAGLAAAPPATSLLVMRCLGEQLNRQKQQQPTMQGAPENEEEGVPPRHTSIILQAGFEGQPPSAATSQQPAAPVRQAETAAAEEQQQAPPASHDLQHVYRELQALQRRLAAAEQRLQLQAPPCDQQQQATGSALDAAKYPPILQAAAVYGSGGSPGSGGSSCSGRQSSPAGAAGRSPSHGSKHAEHRESWQLIRELKQRRAQLEAARLAAASAALAGGALRPCQPPETGTEASATKAQAAPWLFDTRDPPAAAASSLLQQPLPRQAALPGSGRGDRTTLSADRGRARSKEQSPMSWHAARQQLPGAVQVSTAHAARQSRGARGRRVSLSAEPRPTSLGTWDKQRELFQASNSNSAGAGCSRSRSRWQQEEVDRLLMSGRPTTLLGDGGGGGGGGSSSAVKWQAAGRQQRNMWVQPVVLA